MAPARPEDEIQVSMARSTRPDAGNNRARSAGRRIHGTQQDHHSRHSHSAQGFARYSGLEETSLSKTDINKLIVETLNRDWTMELERGRRESVQLQEFRDMLSCATSDQQSLSQKGAEHQSYLDKVQEGSARLLVTLDEKDDLNMFRDDALLRRMRWLAFVGKTRTKRA